MHTRGEGSPLSHCLSLLLASALLVGPARAERTEWNTSATLRTKTIYSDDGDLLYQAHWDVETGQPVGRVLDRRPVGKQGATPGKPAKAAARKGSPRFEAAGERSRVRFRSRAGQLVLLADSLVRVRIDKELHSGKRRTRRGETFPYQLLDELSYGGRVLLAKGTRAEGTVTSVRARGPFGKSGRMTLDFGSIRLASGERVRLVSNRTSEEASKMAATAAGTSAGGMIVLGPIGVVGGLFMKGRDIHIPRGTVTYLAVREDVVVGGS